MGGEKGVTNFKIIEGVMVPLVKMGTQMESEIEGEGRLYFVIDMIEFDLSNIHSFESHRKYLS